MPLAVSSVICIFYILSDQRFLGTLVAKGPTSNQLLIQVTLSHGSTVMPHCAVRVSDGESPPPVESVAPRCPDMSFQ
jgi:hypothetical protein